MASWPCLESSNRHRNFENHWKTGTFEGAAGEEGLAALVALVWLLDVLVQQQVVVEVARALQRGAADVAHGLRVRVRPPVRVQRLLVLQRLAADVAHAQLAAGTAAAAATVLGRRFQSRRRFRFGTWPLGRFARRLATKQRRR